MTTPARRAHAPTPLSANGPALSPIVAGAWRLHSWGWTPQERLRWIEQCVELGITSFDHAAVYGRYTAEGLFGEALTLAPGLRSKLQLVSKCGIQLVSPQRPGNRLQHYDTSAAHIVASAENSLRELRTDHLDLLLVHRPDALLDAAEVVEAFDTLRSAGKVRHFGASNFTPSQFALLDSKVTLATNQIELSPLALDALHNGMLDQAQQLGRRPMIWSPVAGGRLFTGEDERARRVRAVLTSIAERLGVLPATVVYAWLFRLPSRPVPVVGSRRLDAMREAWAALDVQLDAQTWYEIWTASTGHNVP